jgi:hypothetical protein
MPKRDFVFVDEHGDPGLPATGSSHFACIALHLTDLGVPHLVDCFAHLRFFRGVHKELKELDRDPVLRPRLVTMFAELASEHAVSFSVAYLDKACYTGPYLEPGSGTKFRNFQLRRLLEWHFKHGLPVTSECELVLDRHSHSPSQLQNLVEYLNGNFNLPNFSAITAVDSRYVEMIQVADLCLRLFRRKELEKKKDYQSLNLGFVKACDVTLMTKAWRP